MVNDYTGMHIGDLVVLEQMEPAGTTASRQAASLLKRTTKALERIADVKASKIVGRGGTPSASETGGIRDE